MAPPEKHHFCSDLRMEHSMKNMFRQYLKIRRRKYTWVNIMLMNHPYTQFKLDGKEVELTLWDTAGQEDYDTIRTLAYKDVGEYLFIFIGVPWTALPAGHLIPTFQKNFIFRSDMILLLCSYDHQFSLINVRERWLPELKEHNGNVPIFLVAAKSDLKDDVDSKVK